jgi:hypothetical protein
VDDDVGLVEDVVEAVPGRLATRPFFGAAFSFLTPLAASFGDSSFSISFSVSVSISISEATPVVSSPDRISAGASSC